MGDVVLPGAGGSWGLVDLSPWAWWEGLCLSQQAAGELAGMPHLAHTAMVEHFES